MIKILKNVSMWLLASAALALSGCCNQTNNQSEALIDPSIYSSLPFQMDQVQQPSFPDYAVSIADCGAVADSDFEQCKPAY